MLLHGLSATALLNWGPSLAPLGRGFRVVAPDHRGHGRGLPVRGRFRLEVCADDTVAIADALGIERFIAVGYSMGGPVAQLAWRRHQDRVAGLVLCATAASFADTRQRQAAAALGPLLTLAAKLAPSEMWQDVARKRLEGVGDPLLRLAIQNEVANTDAAAVVQAAEALAHFDSRPWLAEIDVPTAVVITTADAHVPLERQRALAEAIPGATTWTVAADHYACVARSDLFVPTLFEACRAVTLGDTERVTA
jgi:3-oxoadipate enol-lactonase